ncbi:polyisoprenoid-binding protein [Helicobacter cholecystus]|uniref:Polyisoprenoid-binding protein n=1 Tax=Helicobacter cholecystus TaxID=45498 RepID=A0A3D8IV57_9HELI|nr:YceI family protein [Helicobacter cholecystus]RDU69112.1 polyisoprenoid-binding protein [Helicobacter cholecystus]VEJ24643.1 Protein yceI precursor [Helicobacter cholecystus]
MKKTFLAFSLVGLIGLNAVEFEIDKVHSSVEFKTKHLLVSNVNGAFEKFDGKIDVDLQNKKLNVFEGEIAIDSINTKNSGRDTDVKGDGFFNSASFPKGYFKMEKQVDNKLYGVLTLKGVSKPVVFDVEISDMVKHPKTQKDVVGIQIEGNINRKDFGIGEKVPDAVVSNKILININLELNK